MPAVNNRSLNEHRDSWLNPAFSNLDDPQKIQMMEEMERRMPRHLGAEIETGHCDGLAVEEKERNTSKITSPVRFEHTRAKPNRWMLE